MDIHTLKENLRSGDASLISSIVGCTQSLTHKVLSGDINHKTYRGERILAVATKIISFRSELKKEFNIAN